MTAQLAGMGSALGLLIWIALNVRHLRAVARWAKNRSRPRISWDDRPRAVVALATLAGILAAGMLLQARWGYGLTIPLAAAGCVLESAVRVTPHLRAYEQRLAMDHVVMSLPLLAALVLAVMGWNRLSP
jgi:hypothetical protein